MRSPTPNESIGSGCGVSGCRMDATTAGSVTPTGTSGSATGLGAVLVPNPWWLTACRRPAAPEPGPPPQSSSTESAAE